MCIRDRESAGGADHGTLAAHGTVHGVKRKSHGGADDGVKAAVLGLDSAYMLDLVADGYAAAAETTLSLIHI